MELTKFNEDYLKAIYILNNGDINTPIRSTDLAKFLKSSKSIVSIRTNELKEKNLLKHDSYGSIQFNEEGLKQATQLFNKYVTIKRFLRLIGCDDETARYVSNDIEHVLDDSIISKLDTFLLKQKN